MDQRAAKRLAYAEGAMIIQNAIEAGWELEVGLSEADERRYRDALDDLIAQMKDRGQGAPVIAERQLSDDPINDDEIGLNATRPPL